MEHTKIILPIKALPWFSVRTGKGNSDASLFYIPQDCRARHRVTGKEEDKGLPCDEYLAGEIYCGHINDKGKRVNHTLSEAGRHRLAHIERYNEYRMNVFHLAKKMKFRLQAAGMAIYYHFPIPVRWTKKKKAIMHGQLKMSKSDCTNLDKALEDALTGKDEGIAHKAGQGKYWFDPDLVEKRLRDGYIEVHLGLPVYNPYGVVLIDPYQLIDMEDIESRRKKLRARKEEIKAEKEALLPKRTPKPLVIDKQKLFKREDKIK